MALNFTNPGEVLSGLSTDSKPTNVSDGVRFYETNTLKIFLKISGSWVEISGGVGVTGPTGPTGVQGTAGTAGITGPTGLTGAQGTAGTAGAAGVFVASTITGPTSCNLVYGTGASAPAASGYNEGTLWLRYTA